MRIDTVIPLRKFAPQKGISPDGQSNSRFRFIIYHILDKIFRVKKKSKINYVRKRETVEIQLIVIYEIFHLFPYVYCIEFLNILKITYICIQNFIYNTILEHIMRLSIALY